jgi:hypothetical protein
VVSLINPHDIAAYPRVFPPNYTQQPPGTLLPGSYSDFYPSFSNLPGTVPYTTSNPISTNWNWDDAVSGKGISLQVEYQDYYNLSQGSCPVRATA